MTILFIGARLRVLDANGAPLAGGLVYTYAAGTLTPKTAYNDAAKTSAKANPFVLDASGEADCWLDGTYKILVTNSSGVTQNGYPVDNIPGSAVAVNDLAAATGATLVGVAGGGNLQTKLDAIVANAKKVPRRQCALSGPHDANGAASLGGATGTATVTTSGIASGANRLTVTAGGGFNADGALDYIGYTESNLVFSGLNINGTMYLYVDITASSGILTAGVTTLAPVYGDGVPSTTNGQFTYTISEGIAYVGNGGTATATARVFIGEVTVAGNVVTAIRWYAYQGRSKTVGAVLAASQVQTLAHNIGMVPRSTIVSLRNTTASSGWVINDEIFRWLDGVSGITDTDVGYGISGQDTVLLSGVGANLAINNKTTAAVASSAKANWTPVVITDRGW